MAVAHGSSSRDCGCAGMGDDRPWASAARWRHALAPGRRTCRNFGSKTVDAAVFGGRAGTKKNFLLRPGRIKRLEIVGLGVRLCQQPQGSCLVRLGTG
jgi:hypothetical protein